MSPLEIKQKKCKATELGLLVALVITLISLEVVSAHIAYETVGAVASALYWAAIGINLPLFTIAFKSRRVAAIGLILWGLVLVPYQFALAGRLWRVQVEAARIVAFTYEAKISSGTFPADLAGYMFHDPTTRPFIEEYRPDAASGGFHLCYWVGTQSTSHCYSPGEGWTFYAD